MFRIWSGPEGSSHKEPLTGIRSLRAHGRFFMPRPSVVFTGRDRQAPSRTHWAGRAHRPRSGRFRTSRAARGAVAIGLAGHCSSPNAPETPAESTRESPYLPRQKLALVKIMSLVQIVSLQAPPAAKSKRPPQAGCLRRSFGGKGFVVCGPRWARRYRRGGRYAIRLASRGIVCRPPSQALRPIAYRSAPSALAHGLLRTAWLRRAACVRSRARTALRRCGGAPAPRSGRSARRQTTRPCSA